MRLKISGKNNSQANAYLYCVLNIATLICKNGYLPTERDVEFSVNFGQWWTRTEKRFDLLASANNHWANIIEEGEDFIVIEFNFRYDKGEKKQSLENLLLAFFPDFVTKY